MRTVPVGLVQQDQLEKAIEDAIRKLPKKDVVRVRYSMGEDWTGDPSIYFRIVLTDAASREKRLAEVVDRISTTIFEELRPLENWGLLPYFSFRSKSEQDQRTDPEWA